MANETSDLPEEEKAEMAMMDKAETSLLELTKTRPEVDAIVDGSRCRIVLVDPVEFLTVCDTRDNKDFLFWKPRFDVKLEEDDVEGDGESEDNAIAVKFYVFDRDSGIIFEYEINLQSEEEIEAKAKKREEKAEKDAKETKVKLDEVAKKVIANPQYKTLKVPEKNSMIREYLDEADVHLMKDEFDAFRYRVDRESRGVGG
jgi:hypothetical protein